MDKKIQYTKVQDYVDKYAKTWFFEPRKCWSCAITVLIDLQEFGATNLEVRNKMVNKLFDWPDALEFILSKSK